MVLQMAVPLAAGRRVALQIVAAGADGQAGQVIGRRQRVAAPEGIVALGALGLREVEEFLRDDWREAVLLVPHDPVGLVVPVDALAGRFRERFHGPALNPMVLAEAPHVPDIRAVVNGVAQNRADRPHAPFAAPGRRDALSIQVFENGADAFFLVGAGLEDSPHDLHALRRADDELGTG
ncbi:MAG: hypothetical protein ABSA67_02115 [Candidatus Brocadiia bacterium]